MWSGSISFGLVNVPVRLYTATRSKDVRFHGLHDADGGRIRQKRVCSKDGEEIPFEHVVKGYELGPDRYVVITAEELESVAPKATRTIEIEEFVDLSEIDPLFYESSYYLAPDKGAAKAYALLQGAMRDSEKVAIGRVVLRSKEYLAAIRPVGDALTLATMRFADEVVDASTIDGVPGAEVEASGRELAIAKQLIESLSAPFEPSKYRDTYREAVLAMIERKAEGEQVLVQEAPTEAAPVADLMAALEASLAEAKARRQGTEPAAKKPPARRRTRKAAAE